MGSLHITPSGLAPAVAEGTREGPGDVTLAQLIERHRFPEGYRRIFLAAIETFSERGFHGTSTRDIAARAGMSPAALYVHFGSKEEVLYRIATSGLDITLEVMSGALTCAAAPSDRLRAVVRAVTAWHAHHSAAARVILYEQEALTPEHLAEVLVKEREIDQILRGIIVEGVRAREFDVPDMVSTAAAILSLCMDIARWYRPGHRRTPEDMGDAYAEAAVRIVGAR
jgi:AcrR family transcriptional regulator